MCTHCLNVLSALRKCFLKQICIPSHMLNTHFSHFVALHLNFFFATTYDFCEPINSTCGTRETLDMGILRQYSLSLAEARALCISIAFSTQIHSIVCMPSNQHQVPFFRCIRFCKQGLLITLHLGAYCGLYSQKNGFCSVHVMLIVILRTLRQPFPCQL